MTEDYNYECVPRKAGALKSWNSGACARGGGSVGFLSGSVCRDRMQYFVSVRGETDVSLLARVISD